MTENKMAGIKCSDTSREIESFQTGHQHAETVKKQENNDHLFTEESLELLHEVNEQFGVVRSTGKRFRIIRRYKSLSVKDRIETYFISRATLKDHFSSCNVKEWRRGKLVRVRLSDAWLKWSGKREFRLCG